MKNNQSLSDLLAGFFDYYNRFDYDDVISIRLGTAVPVNDPLLILSNSQGFLEKGIRIEEPFEGSNTARAVWKTESVAKVKFALGKALKVININASSSAVNMHTDIAKAANKTDKNRSKWVTYK